MQNNKIGYFILIPVILFAGCVDYLPPPEASPSEVVETFVSGHGNYYLMSADYKNSISEASFLGKIIRCKPSFKHYEFAGIINGSERIEGDSATVAVRYREKPDKPVFGNYSLSEEVPKNKTVYLTRENDGWRLRDLNCELVGR